MSVIIIQVPTLKQRLEDIPLLVNRFLEDIAKEYGMKKKTITDKAIKQLQTYPWNGNIRELRNVVERLVIMCNQIIDQSDVKKYVEVS